MIRVLLMLAGQTQPGDQLDLTAYLVAVAGVPLIFLVFGAVELMKRLKTRTGEQLIGGNALLLLSLGWGLVVGAGYMLALEPPPAGFVWKYWFSLACYGLGLGFFASVFFDALKALVEKAVGARAKVTGG